MCQACWHTFSRLKVRHPPVRDSASPSIGRGCQRLRRHESCCVAGMTQLRALDDVDDELSSGYSRHARFIDPAVPYHIASRVVQGFHLLRPCRELNELVCGIIGRAQERYSDVILFATAFMSNHFHMILQGPPTQVPAFIGYVKREIALRWARRVDPDWRGPMWHEYVALALPTAAGQVEYLKYVLSQGVKEGLVARSVDWPGVHCARSLLDDEPMRGRWFDGTSYCRARDAQSRKASPGKVQRAPYFSEYNVRLAPIPAWRDLDPLARRAEVSRLLQEIEEDGRALGHQPLGARAVCRMPVRRRTEVPKPPWCERRRKVICCGPRHDPDVRRYHATYRIFQTAFAEARAADREHRGAAFPPGSHTPGWWTPLRTSHFAA